MADEPMKSNILTFTKQKQSCWVVDGSPDTYYFANVTMIVSQFGGAKPFYSRPTPVSG